MIYDGLQLVKALWISDAKSQHFHLTSFYKNDSHLSSETFFSSKQAAVHQGNAITVSTTGDPSTDRGKGAVFWEKLVACSLLYYLYWNGSFMK